MRLHPYLRTREPLTKSTLHGDLYPLPNPPEESKKLLMNGMPSSLHSNSEPTEIFRSSWSLYDAIIDANYMFHHEIAENLSEVVAEFSTRISYTVLDLGCSVNIANI